MNKKATDRFARFPLISRVGRAVSASLQRIVFRGSGEYWESRYRRGGTSGAGSYNELAEFKAEVLNGLVREHEIRSVIEFGCGDGNQLALAAYPAYIGLDVSRTALQLTIARFEHDPRKSFFLYDPHIFRDSHELFQADAALSLDVIYHLVEDDVFELYMRHLFSAARRLVVIYSTDTEDNRGPRYPHQKHRCFSRWTESHCPHWALVRKIPNRYPFDAASHSGSCCDFFIYERI